LITGLTDGQPQNGFYDGKQRPSAARRCLTATTDWIVCWKAADAPFDMAQGTIEWSSPKASQVGSSPDNLVSRGEWADRPPRLFGMDVTAKARADPHFSGSGENAR